MGIRRVIPRITKEVASRLLPFANKLVVTGGFTDPAAKSAYEFYRQMSGRSSMRANASFQVDLIEVEADAKGAIKPPSIKAEFANGAVLEMPTTGTTCSDLRLAFFTKCEEVSDHYEDMDDEPRTNIPVSFDPNHPGYVPIDESEFDDQPKKPDAKKGGAADGKGGKKK